jgi:cephalosporin-C deacetylase
MKKNIFAGVLFVLFGFNGFTQHLLPAIWKFQTGDNPEWSKPSFNDSGWKDISVNDVWEKQGYPAYDGYAWYRAKVVIPSKFRAEAEKYGGFLLKLGKIDDADYTYFNGSFLAKTGELPPNFESKWNTDRDYLLPSAGILWDKPNTIAVRVYDLSGNGGIYEGPVNLIIKGLSDKILVSPLFKNTNRIITGPNANLPVTVKNECAEPLKGKITLKVVSDFRKEITTMSRDFSVRKNSESLADFGPIALEPGFYKASVVFENDKISKQTDFMFGYEPEKIISPADPQPDFSSYWLRAKKELAAVDPQYKLIKQDSLCTATRDFYLVEMRSLGNILIRGWYSKPKAAGKYPAILQVQGYSSVIIPPYINYGEDFVSFGLNIRGHGNSRDDINPGFPGFLLYFLGDKELYIYRGAYMDCVRAVDFLFTRAEVDTTRVVVEGASQGGALTFATAALNNTRIRLCVPQVPFLSDFPHYFKVANWPANEFVNYVEVEKKQSWEEVFKTLSYIDIKNLASWIKAPMLMGAGLVDETCPPHINFAAYNNVTSDKEYVIYPLSGHNLPADFYSVKMNWIRAKLGMK